MQYEAKNPTLIKELFDSIAPRYDFANSLLSFHLHTFWNRSLVNEALKNSNPKAILDLCSGTGEIAFRLLSKTKKNKTLPKTCHLVDLSPKMLNIAEARSKKLPLDIQNTLNFLEGNAENLTFANESFDLITCAYGIRNVQNPQNAFKEMYRILQPSGISAIVELTRPKNFFLKLGHSIFLKTYVPLVGKCFTSNKEAYNYLNKTIHSFMNPQDLQNIAISCGFSQTKIIPLLGGIATILILKK